MREKKVFDVCFLNHDRARRRTRKGKEIKEKITRKEKVKKKERKKGKVEPFPRQNRRLLLDKRTKKHITR